MVTLYEAVLHDKANVGTDNEVSNLMQQINSLQHDKSSSRTNLLCWRSESKFTNINWLLSEITSLVNSAIDYYSSKDPIFREAFEQINRKDLGIFYWTNVNEPMSRNVLHAHKTGIFSGVYYIQGTDTGDLRLINPANTLTECNVFSPFTRDFYYTPKDRDLILWPSWLPHEVETNTSNRQRINIAYDIYI